MTKPWVRRPTGSNGGDWGEDDELGRGSFPLTAPPPRLPGTTGSQLTPIATV